MAEIRKAKAREHLEISDMIMDSIESYHADHYSEEELAIWKRAFMPDAIKKIIRDSKSWVLLDKDTVAGFIQYDVPEIKSVYLSPNLIGQGFGKLLVQHTLDEISTTEIRQVEVICTTYVKGFYETLGFKEKDAIITYWEKHPFQEYLLVKNL